MRRLLKPLWVFLALVFVFEAWLWGHLEPVVSRIVALIPLAAAKAWLAALVERLPPIGILLVFATPIVALFFVELALVWLVADYWFLVGAVLILAKFASVGITAFVFTATRPKLLQIRWFAWGYDKVLAGLAWAHRLADPYIATVRGLVAKLRGHGEVWRMIRSIRERVRRARSV